MTPSAAYCPATLMMVVSKSWNGSPRWCHSKGRSRACGQRDGFVFLSGGLGILNCVYIYIYYIYIYNYIYIILYYIILYHIISYYIISYHIILYCTVLYYIILYYIILYCIILYYIILYYIIYILVYIGIYWYILICILYIFIVMYIQWRPLVTSTFWVQHNSYAGKSMRPLHIMVTSTMPNRLGDAVNV